MRADIGVTGNLSVTAAFAPVRSTAVTIQSAPYSAKLALRHGVFVLSGMLTPGAYLDPVVVEVRKPRSARWSHSSNRLCYETVSTSGHWWYRYTPLLRGTYSFRARFVGDVSRYARLSRRISAVAH